jgi:hypothetical protein
MTKHPYDFGPIPKFNNIPKEIREGYWCAWKAKPRGEGKFDKIPYNFNKPIGTNAPDDWLTFDQAKELYEKGGFNGVGRLMTKDGVTGVDGDGSLTLPDEVKALGATYAEKSPSGNGLRLFYITDTIPDHDITSPIEIYSGNGARFLTVTGNVVGNFNTVTRLNGQMAKLVSSLSTDDPFTGKSNDENNFLAGVDDAPAGMTADEVRSILDRYPAGDLGENYEEWKEVGMAVKHELGSDSFGVWLEWSRKSPHHGKKYSERVMKYKWDSFGKNPHINPVRMWTIVRKANAKNPVRLDDADFEVLEDTVEKSKFPTAELLTIPESIEPRKILMNGSYIKGYLTGTAAAGGVGKTSLVDIELMSLALGEDLLSQDQITGARDVLRCGAQRILMLSLEDDKTELQRRKMAIAQKYCLTPEELSQIESNTVVIYDDRSVMKIVSAEGLINKDLVKHLVSVIKNHKIDVMTIDPLVSFHSVGENDNGAMQIVMATLRTLARVQNVAVHYIHHNRKGGGGSVDDMRGAGALKDGSRHVRMLTPMNAMEAQEMGVSARDASYLVGMATGKGNFEDPSGRSKCWYKLDSVCLNNGNAVYDDDWLGVVVKWVEPNNADQDLDWLCSVVDELNAGCLENRKASNSPNYIIRMVCRVGGLDYEESALRKKARSKLDQWVGAGWIEEYQEHDSRNGKDYSVYRSAVTSEVIRSADLLDGLSG